MFKVEFTGLDNELKQINKLAEKSTAILKIAVFDGAAIIADEIKAGIKSLPTEPFHYVKDGNNKMNVLTPEQKDALASGFGISTIRSEGTEIVNYIGFAGYTGYPTNRYPRGLPIPMLARSVESGTSVRRKHPFVRPAVNRAKKRAEAAMEKTLTEVIENIANENQ